MQQKVEKIFFFSDNIIWIVIVLLRAGYLSSASNVLASSPKIWRVIKGDFLEHSFVSSGQWIW